MTTDAVRYDNPNPQPSDWARALAGFVQGGAGQIAMQQQQAQKQQEDLGKILPYLAQQNRLSMTSPGAPGAFKFGGQNWGITPPPTNWEALKNQQETLKLQNENQNPMDFIKRDAAKAQLTQLGNPLTWRNGQPPTQDQYLQIMQNINAMMSGATGPQQQPDQTTGGPSLLNPSTWGTKPTVTPGAVTRTVLDKASNKMVTQTLTGKGWVSPEDAAPVSKGKKMSTSLAQTFYDQAQGSTHQEKLNNAMQAATAAGYDITQ